MGNYKTPFIRHRIWAGAFSLVLLLAAAGCMAQSKMGKLQEAATTLNTATRFGRMDVATELVARDDLQPFAKRHAAWGSMLRIVDVEYQGIQFVEDNKAIVLVAVGWQRPDETNLRVTQLAQVWDYGQGGWKLSDETRNAGDMGLLGESIDVLRPEGKQDTHFPTITIR